MKSPLLRLLPLAAVLATPLPLCAQGDKARNFYEALLKRPAATALFDQFYNTWLDTDTVEKLEKFLTDGAEKTVEGRMVLASFYVRQGDLDKAAEAWRAALKKAPQRAEGWLALADLEARLRNNKEALEAAESGLEAKPGAELERRLLEFKARALARDEQREEARIVWETLLRKNPKDEDLRDDYIDLLLQTGENDVAVEEARKLADATTDPYRRVMRRARLADLLAGAEEAEAALEAYGEALADTGAGSWLEKDLLRQIEAVHRRGDRFDALADFLKDLAEKEPRRLGVRRALARVLTEKGKPEEADTVWRALLAAAPGDRELAEGFIEHLTVTRRHAESAAQWRTLIAQHTADAELHLKLAAALHAGKDEAGCVTAVRGYLKAAGGTEEAATRAAAELSKFHLAKEALTLLAETAQKFPGSEAARLQYASALHEADRKEEARAAWKAEAALPGRLVATARAALTHGENALAWELLEPHLAEFGKDAATLTLFCDAAMRAEKWAAGVAQSRRLLELAGDAVALGEALGLTLRMAERGKLRETLRQDLETRRAELAAPEKCLLAELLQGAGDRQGAAKLLEEVSAKEPALGLALLVRLHAATRDFVAAAHVQKRLVEGPGGRKPLHIQRLIELCADAKMTEEALRWIKEWKKLAPGNAAPWLREASLLQMSGRASEAVDRLEQASHLWPEDMDILARFGAALTGINQPERAQRVYLRLFEKAQGTEDKLRWLPSLVESAATVNQLDALIEDFQRRRGQNRQSPVPLLALAECYRQNGNDAARLEAMRDAARLGEGDPVMLMRAAESAVESGLLETAESMLAEAAGLDKTGLALQQRAAVLLRLGRNEEAGALLTRLSTGMNAEDSAELALTLSNAGHAQGAALFLTEATKRFPDNYRLGWMAAQLTALAEEKDRAREQFLRLATGSFPPMPEAPLSVESAQAQSGGFVNYSPLAGRSSPWGTAGSQNGVPPPVLEPVPERVPPPPAGSEQEMVCILQAMEEQPGSNTREINGITFATPRVPGPLWRMRGWAAHAALRLAAEEGPERVAEVKAALLAAGLRPAIFSEAIAGGQMTGIGTTQFQPDISTAGPDTGWVLRSLLGPLPDALKPVSLNQPDVVVPADPFATPDQIEMEPYPADPALSYGQDGLRPYALAAWRHFRESDQVYAVHAALMLLNSKVPAEMEAAGEAITLLEQQGGKPGPLLTGARTAMEAKSSGNPFYFLSDNENPALRARLLALIPPWHRAAPAGPERDWLRAMHLNLAAQGDDPAAYLNLIAEEIAAGSPDKNPNPNPGGGGNFLGLMDDYSGGQLQLSPQVSQMIWQSGAVIAASGGSGQFVPQQPPLPVQRPAAPPSPANTLPQPGARLLRLPFAPEPNESFAGDALPTPLYAASWRLAPGQWSADAVKLRAAVEACPHTGLKALASLLLKDEALTARCMKSLTTEQPAVPEHLVLAAADAWRNRRAEEAMMLLAQASGLTNNSLPAVDTAIAAAVNLLLWAREPVTEAVKTAAVAALERMAAQGVEASCREGLAGIARALDEPKLIEAVYQPAPVTATAAGTPPPLPPPPSKTMALSSLVYALQRSQRPMPPAAGGKRTAGVVTPPEREAALLLAQARHYANQGPAAQRPVTPQLPGSIRIRSLTEGNAEDTARNAVVDVARALHQRAEQATGSELLVAGMALLFYEGFQPPVNLELSEPFFEKAIAAAPVEQRQRVRLQVCNAVSWTPLPMEQLVPSILKLSAPLPPVDRGRILKQTLFQCTSDDGRHSGNAEMGVLLAAILKTLRELPSGDVSLDPTIVTRTLNGLWLEIPGGSVPPLSGLLPTVGPTGSPTSADAVRRRELFTGLCREFLRSPSTASAAFSQAMIQVNRGALEWPSRRDDALALLLMYGLSSDWYHPWPGRALDYTDVMVEEAVADPAWLEKTVVPALRAHNNFNAAAVDILAKQVELFRCAPDEFAAVLDHIAADMEESQRPAFTAQGMAIAGLRGLETLTPEMIRRVLASPAGRMMPGQLSATISLLEKKGGQAAVNAWVESACGDPQPADIWTNPAAPEGQPGRGFTALVQALNDQGFLGPGGALERNPLIPMRLYRALQKPLLTMPKDVSAVIAFGFPIQDYRGDSDELLAVLDAAGFLEDLPEFHPVLHTVSRNEPADFATTTLGLSQYLRMTVGKDVNGAAAGPLLDKLQKNYAKTFGGRLAAAIVREVLYNNTVPGDKAAPPHVLPMLAAELPRLKALPEERQLEFVNFPAHNDAGDNKEAQAAEKWLSGLEARATQRLLDRMTALTDDALMREPGLPVRLARLCTVLLPEQPEAVLKLLSRVESLPKGTGPGPSVADIAAGTLSNWGDDAPPETQALRCRVMLTLITAPSAAVPEPHRIATMASGLLQRWLLPENGNDQLPAALPDMMQRVEATPEDFLTEKQARMLLPAAMQLAVYNKGDREDGRFSKMAADALENPGPGGRLRRVLAQAFRLAELNASRTRETTVPAEAWERAKRAARAKGYEMPDSQDSYVRQAAVMASALTDPQEELLAFLADASVSQEVRSTLCEEPLKAMPRVFDPPLFGAAAALLQSGKGHGPEWKEHLYAVAAALAEAAALFPAPATPADVRRAEERAVTQAMVENFRSGGSVDGMAWVTAARSADDLTILELVRTAINEKDRALTGIFRTLVNHRRFPAAAVILTEVPDRLFPLPTEVYDETELYAPVTAAALQEWLPSLPSRAEQLTARGIMEAAMDSPALVAAGGPTRSQRLEVLAKALPGETVPLAWLRRVLLVFGPESYTRPDMQPLLQKAVEGSTLAQVVSAPLSLQFLYLRYLTREAEAGRMTALLQAAGDIPVLAKAVRDDQKESLWNLFSHALWEHGGEWPESARPAALEVLRTLALDTSDLAHRLNTSDTSDTVTRLACCLVIHAAWNALPSLEVALGKLPAGDRKLLMNLPGTAYTVLELLSMPPEEVISSEPAGRESRVPVRERGATLARLLTEAPAIPRLEIGMVLDFVKRQKAGLDTAPLLALVPGLLRHPEETSARALLWDLSLLLAEAGRTDEARQVLLVMESEFAVWRDRTVPGSATSFLSRGALLRRFEMLFNLHRQLDGDNAALTWALQSGAGFNLPLYDTEGPFPDMRLHEALNLTDSALLKSAGADAWKKLALERLAAAQPSALGVIHAACVLEKAAHLESVAGRKEEAFALMSLAMLTAARSDGFASSLFDQTSREIFTANYADLALRAGRKVELVELVPLNAKWQYNLYWLPGSPAGAAQTGQAPLGWGQPAPATVIQLPPPAEEGDVRPGVTVSIAFDIKDIEAVHRYGSLYCTLCDIEDARQAFQLDRHNLSWSDSGRPELTPDLSVLTKNAGAAAAATTPRTTLLSPSMLEGSKPAKHSMTVFIPVQKRFSDTLHFDAALHGLKMNFADAVEQAETHRAELEAAAPEFWKQLPEWVRRKGR